MKQGTWQYWGRKDQPSAIQPALRLDGAPRGVRRTLQYQNDRLNIIRALSLGRKRI